ncbi:hypothetical protein [Escherichia coli]|uniref:hypothetical protein n=1 Tax=Escherichia coli TaxID=562 RepID=UPI0009441EFE|nr:hypothetical protein [Escherichia coli]EKI2792409.1 hypothetical protein [Escherichia coli]OKV95900.1 hypothetical protein AWP67_00930 [Escherichia coli]
MTNINETIWQKKQLPPLEFCSLDRAAQILECEIDDLWHWQDINRINFATKIKNAYCEGYFGYRDFTWPKDEDHIDFISFLIKKEISSLGIIIHEYSDEIKENGVIFEAKVSGVFDIQETIVRNKTISMNTSIPLSRRTANPTFIFSCHAKTSGNIKITPDSLLITREHIDNLYKSITNGFPIYSINNTIKKENHKLPRLTIHQFKMIYGLLRIAGLTDNEIISLPPNKLNKKIAQIGAQKGIVIPQPDKNTWKSWRERFR